MKDVIANEVCKQAVAGLGTAKGGSRYGAFIGLDVHKETIAVPVALEGREEPVYRGEIAHQPKAVRRLQLGRSCASMRPRLL